MIREIIISMRPRQWTKNLIIFAALVFSKSFIDTSKVLKAVLGFAVFCLLSGCTYIINDLRDRQSDSLHPKKSLRPIASGHLNPQTAILSVIIMLALALGAAFLIDNDLEFGLICATYVALSIFYTMVLKHIAIADVLIISIGFVLRAAAGGVVINVAISAWLLFCTMLLALFLALCKRRNEMTLLEDNHSAHRKSLEDYSPELIDQMIGVVSSSTVMAYALYTMWPRTVNEISDKLHFTIPFVLYGIFRYLYLVHHKNIGGRPEEALLTDRPLLVSVILWLISVVLILLLDKP